MHHSAGGKQRKNPPSDFAIFFPKMRNWENYVAVKYYANDQSYCPCPEKSYVYSYQMCTFLGIQLFRRKCQLQLEKANLEAISAIFQKQGNKSAWDLFFGLLRFVMVYILGLRPLRLKIRIEVKLTTRKTVKATLRPMRSEKSFSTISCAATKKRTSGFRIKASPSISTLF